MRMMPMFGDVRDNAAAFASAMFYINHNDLDMGLHILSELRDFIQSTQEVQSLCWVLPAIEEWLCFQPDESLVNTPPPKGSITGLPAEPP